jgi:hypothetical protein
MGDVIRIEELPPTDANERGELPGIREVVHLRVAHSQEFPKLAPAREAVHRKWQGDRRQAVGLVHSYILRIISLDKPLAMTEV